MAKYRNYSKKLLAIVLVLATVLTTGSFNMEALAKGYSDAPNDSIPSGGYIGQISTNGLATNQQVSNISFKIVKEAGKTYICTADIYENPTDENDPESGVHRVTIEKDVEASQTQEEATIDIPVSLEITELTQVSITSCSFTFNVISATILMLFRHLNKKYGGIV